MLRLALRNLFESKVRLLVSVGGVALAFTLVLALDAIFAGSERQVTAYIEQSEADVVVSQAGVRNMHMASSSIPRSLVPRIEGIPGVESVTPILYVTNMLVLGEERSLAYVIGLPEAAEAGKPREIVKGKAVPSEGEAVIDQGVAEKSGAGLGDEVKILGETFEIAGLSRGTASLTNSVSFIALEDFSHLTGDGQTVSFILVKASKGVSPGELASEIEMEINGVTAQTGVAFAERERGVIRDMGTDIIAVMNFIGFLTGLAVMALTVYLAALARRKEYGILKALGAGNRRLYATVLAQAVFSVVLGFALGLILTLALGELVPLLGVNLSMEVSGRSLIKVAAMSLLIGGLSAILPVRQIAGLDPAVVFRRAG